MDTFMSGQDQVSDSLLHSIERTKHHALTEALSDAFLSLVLPYSTVPRFAVPSGEARELVLTVLDVGEYEGIERN